MLFSEVVTICDHLALIGFPMGIHLCLILVVATLAIPAQPQKTFGGCKMEGNARTANAQAHNCLKNRGTGPLTRNSGITREAMLGSPSHLTLHLAIQRETSLPVRPLAAP